MSVGSRVSTLDDLHAFHRLAHLSPSMHLSGGIICEPVDVAVPKRLANRVSLRTDR